MTKLTLQFFGDIALERGVESSEAQEKISETVKWLSREVPEADLRIVNWEAPLRGTEGRHHMEKPIVSTCEDSARAFLKFRIDVATLANNHIFDYKSSGLKNTVDFLTNSSVKTVGAGTSPEQAYSALNMDKNGLNLTFLTYVGEDTNPPPEEPGMFVNVLKKERVLEETRRWSQSGRKVIVIFHWGLENEAYPSPEKRSFARRVIEAGASVVVCHHAHRIQGHEKWLQGHIFYGLGNFIFGIGYNYIWPFFTNPTVVAYCGLDDAGVSEAGLIHFEQIDTVFSKPDAKKALKREDRLNWPLSLSDKNYRFFWKLFNIYHLVFEKPVEAFQRRGIKAVFKINKEHLLSLKDLFKTRKST